MHLRRKPQSSSREDLLLKEVKSVREASINRLSWSKKVAPE